MIAARAREMNEVELFRFLGVNVYNDFPLNLLADEALEAKQNGNQNKAPFWNNGETQRPADMVRLLVLNDLLPNAPGIREILESTPENQFGVGLPNLLKFLEYIIQTEFVIQGETRQQCAGNQLQNKFVTSHSGHA